jgi:hypothetical protein
VKVTCDSSVGLSENESFNPGFTKKRLRHCSEETLDMSRRMNTEYNLRNFLCITEKVNIAEKGKLFTVFGTNGKDQQKVRRKLHYNFYDYSTT